MSEKADQALFDLLTQEYNLPFSGWDFSYLNGRTTSIRTTPAWDYTLTVTAAMKQIRVLLDMHTGSGEVLVRLLSFQHVPDSVCHRVVCP
jgi:hypothetical protein